MRFTAWLLELLSWLWPARVNGFTERERLIFRFWDGDKIVGADPLRIHDAMLDVPDLKYDGELACLETDDVELRRQSAAARVRLAGHLQQVFGVAPFSDVAGKRRGLTDAELLNLMIEFEMFIRPLKKKRPAWLTSSAISPEPSSTADDSPTENSAASCGTEIVPSSAVL